jgi:LmbE family N-acetylglucosaminyl deacetylase
MNNVLEIGAQPADLDFGCSGTLKKHINKGDSVHIVVMTGTESVDGTTGQVIRTMKQFTYETEQAAKIIGATSVDFLGYKDLHVPFNFESVSKLETLIKQYNIDTIYTHWEGDANQDHISTFKTTMAAARYVRNVYCYEQIPIPRLYLNQFIPDSYVDISTTFDTKEKASLAHQSQIQKYENSGLSVLYNLKLMAEYRGIQANCKYAEAFHVIKQVR